MDIWTSLGRFAFFETERLSLRPFAFTDSADFWEICRNPDNLQFIFPSRASQAESDYLLVHYFMKEPLGTWAIEDKQSHKMIGAIRFEKLDVVNSRAEIGYFLHQDFWGQGLVTECLKTLVFLSFQEFGLKALHIVVHDDNQASQRVAEKAGFQLITRFKGSDRYTHKMRDYVTYRISRGKYFDE